MLRHADNPSTVWLAHASTHCCQACCVQHFLLAWYPYQFAATVTLWSHGSLHIYSFLCCWDAQERDPRSYQIYLQLPGGACFLGSTPEQLYVRSGQAVASEAVAATRPRGPPGTFALPEHT